MVYDGLVFRLIAGMEPGAMPKYRALFRRFAHSFRPISDDERASIEELRLRTVMAIDGETVKQLSERSGNEWDPLYTAVVNGLFIDDRLYEGQRIKIVRPEPYRPRPPEETTERDAEP